MRTTHVTAHDRGHTFTRQDLDLIREAIHQKVATEPNIDNQEYKHQNQLLQKISRLKETAPQEFRTPRNHQEVSQQFAQGATKGEAANIIIDGDTIYSYGTHFPIARREGNIAFFTTQGYSNTTSKHKSRVYAALANEGYLIIETKDPTSTDYKQIYQELTQRQLDLDNKKNRARTDTMRGYYTQKIENLNNQKAYLKQEHPEAAK